MTYKLHGRPVVDVRIERGATRDVCDAFVSHAAWDDTSEELSEEELEELQDSCGDEITNQALEEGAWH